MTLGVPRLTELINVAATLKTPAMLIRVNEELQFDSDMYSSHFPSRHCGTLLLFAVH